MKATGPTHSQLVRRAASWLRARPGNCRIVLNDVHLMSVQEQPDVIGWRGNGDSVLIECKASKSDLRVDRHKPWRRDPAIGVGRQRYMFLPDEPVLAPWLSLVGPEWGIVVWSGKGKPRLVRSAGMRARTDVNLDEERVMLVHALLRATEGWGRQMFFEDGDPGPRFTAIIRGLRDSNRKLAAQLRERRVADAEEIYDAARAATIGATPPDTF